MTAIYLTRALPTGRPAAKNTAPYGGLDLAVPSTPANSFITDICFWFVRGRGNWLATRVWVSLLGSLEIPEPTARTALHRMTKAGFLERRANDRRPGYEMSDAWLKLMDYFGDEKPAPTDDSDDTWTLVTFSIPEKKRADRHAMRTLLGRYGFAPLSNGVWIASASRLEIIREMLASTTFGNYVDIFHARHEGFTTLSEIASACWDIDSMKAAYKAFIADTRRRLRASDRPDERAFAALVRTTNAWRRVRFIDPDLPRVALPDDWPQAEAKRLRDEVIARFLEPAREYVATLS
jgi:phenylacetic acid degradation operon negative regulatory protein